MKALESYYNANLDEAQEPAGEVLLRALKASLALIAGIPGVERQRRSLRTVAK